MLKEIITESLKQNYFTALSYTDLCVQMSPADLSPGAASIPLLSAAWSSLAEVSSSHPT